MYGDRRNADHHANMAYTETWTGYMNRHERIYFKENIFKKTKNNNVLSLIFDRNFDNYVKSYYY